MLSLVKLFYERIYRKTEAPEDLPWHRTEPWPMLVRALERRTRTGRALDVGCGTGTHSVYLARQGYGVTSLDFVERALELTRERARAEKVELDAVHANALEWQPPSRFDVILDSGCLHGLGMRADRERYRERLLGWLADDGDYVLVHFAPLHRFDWRPMGPRRIERGRVLALFSPELCEMAHDAHIESAALPIGPRIKLGEYWFERNRQR